MGEPLTRFGSFSGPLNAVRPATLTADGQTHAAVWQNGTVTDLGVIADTLGSFAVSINSFGQVVGYSSGIPFIWDNVNGVRELYFPVGLLGIRNATLFNINDAGQVLGNGEIDDHAVFFLLTPNTSTTSMGSNVLVQSGGATLTFSSVTSSGTTTVTPDQTSAANYSLSNNLGAYDISTTAIYNTSGYASDPIRYGIKVTFYVSSIDDPNVFNGLTITHVENGQPIPYNGTIDPQKITYHDFTSRKVWVYVPSLSPFVIVNGVTDQISDLIRLVTSFNLQRGIQNSLDVKLQNAQDALTAARSGNRSSACNSIASFINEALAQSGNALSVAQANQLIASARQIRITLGCR